MRFKRGVGLLLLLAVCWHATAGERTPTRKTSPSPPILELRGKMVCLSEEMHRLYGAPLAEKHTHDYGFKSEAGDFYSLLRAPGSEALLTDTNLHTRILLVKGKAFPKTHILEVVGNLHSVKDGKLNELYYYCDICSIKTSVPGPCMCCREPVHLVEEPVSR